MMTIAGFHQARLGVVIRRRQISNRTHAVFFGCGNRHDLNTAVEVYRAVGSVADDLQQPAASVDSFEAREIGQCPHHCILQYVLSRLGVAHQPARKVVCSVEVRQHYAREPLLRPISVQRHLPSCQLRRFLDIADYGRPNAETMRTAKATEPSFRSCSSARSKIIRQSRVHFFLVLRRGYSPGRTEVPVGAVTSF